MGPVFGGLLGVSWFMVQAGRITTTPAQDPGDFELPTGWWFVEERIPPGTNYNIDYSGLHAELLRQTKLALGKP